MKKVIKIAILDTYVNFKHSNFRDMNIHIPFSYMEHNLDLGDKITHADLVCSLIIKECKNIDVTVYPVFSLENFEADIKEVLDVLDKIKKEDFDIISLSMGTNYLDYYSEFERICEEITKKEMVIVAAYDNNGMISVPSVFPNVIGVDCELENIFGNDYVYEENGIVNIRGPKRGRRINIGEKFTVASGSSFFAAYITGIIAQWIFQNNFNNKLENVHKFLKRRAVRTDKIKSFSKERYPNFQIKKAVILPFNKEIQTLARLKNSLNFDIVGFYDFKHFFRCGKSLEALTGCEDLKSDVLQNVEKIKWTDDFDTVILGHIKEILEIIGDDFLKYMLRQCEKYNKCIYSFDNILNYIENRQTKVYTPYVTHKMLPQGRHGKLWDIPKPVLGVFGTRTQQGKFTIQQLLRKRLSVQGYRCGYLSTEPSGFLFGADEIFAYGHNSSVEISESEYVVYVNELMHQISLKNNDIILLGGQSGIVPYDFGNMSRILLKQTAFLYGANPDGVIMCVCCDDEIDYIKRSVHYIENACEAKVIAFFVFPLVKDMYFTGQYRDRNISKSDEYLKFKKILQSELECPVYDQKLDEIDKCIENIVDFFG